MPSLSVSWNTDLWVSNGAMHGQAPHALTLKTHCVNITSTESVFVTGAIFLPIEEKMNQMITPKLASIFVSPPNLTKSLQS